MSGSSRPPFDAHRLNRLSNVSHIPKMPFHTSLPLPDLIENPETTEDEVHDEAPSALPPQLSRLSSLSHQASTIASSGVGLLQHQESKTKLGRQASVVASGPAGLKHVSRPDLLSVPSVSSGRAPSPTRTSGPAFASGLLPISGVTDSLPETSPRPSSTSRRSSFAEDGETLTATQSLPTDLPKDFKTSRRGTLIKVGDDGIPEHLALAAAEAETAAERERKAAMARSRRGSAISTPSRSRPHTAARTPIPAFVPVIAPHLASSQPLSSRLYQSGKIKEGRGADPGSYLGPFMWPTKEEVRKQRKELGKDPDKDDWTKASARFAKLKKSRLGPGTYVAEHRGTLDGHTPDTASVVLKSRVGRFPVSHAGVDNVNIAPGCYAVEIVKLEHGYRPWIASVQPRLGRLVKSFTASPWAPPTRLVDVLSDSSEATNFADAKRRLIAHRITREEETIAAATGAGQDAAANNLNSLPRVDTKAVHPLSAMFLVAPVPPAPPAPPLNIISPGLQGIQTSIR